MTSPAYSPEPSYSPEQYQRAKKALSTGAIPPDKVEVVNTRLAEFEKSQAESDQARGYRQNSQLDPAKEELVKRVRRATRDDTLPNASGLKVYSAPPEFEPPVKANPFSPMSPLAFAPPKNNVWHEPSVKDFRAALSAGGPLADRAKRELGSGAYGDDAPQVPLGPNEHAPYKPKDITQIGNKPTDPKNYDDAVLENSEAFKAYRDAAWQHALADAVAKKQPIYRAAFTQKLSDTEKSIAGAQDTGGAVVGGMGQAATMGLLDPLKRSINPDLAAKDRQQRNRSPKAEMVGEFGGAMVGAPEAIARGTAKVIGKQLGGGPLGRLATSAVAGAVTGGVDAQTRAIAQSAADALEAGDSATEMAKRIYDALSLSTAGGGAAIGGGAGVAGHAIGSTLNAGARKIVTGGEQGPVVERNLASGGKMDWKGQIKEEPRLEDLRHGAAAENKFADEVLAERALDPIATHQLGKQEEAARKAMAETAIAQERLGSATVDAKMLSERVAQLAKEIPGATPRSKSTQTAIRRWARKIRDMENITPAEMDKLEEEIALQARYKGGDPDPHWNQVGGVVKDFRDEFQFNEPTAQFSIRDKLGNPKVVSGYSGMKKGQERALGMAETENRQLGLPKTLEAAPTELPRTAASDAEAGQFIAQHPDMPSVLKYLNEERAAASRLERGDTPSDLTPARVNSAMQATTGANRALRAAVKSGHVYPGTVYRGVGMTPDKIQEMIARGEVKNDSIWSAAKDQDYAAEFAKKSANKGRQGVVFEIDSRSAVPLDDIPGSNTYNEAAIPIGESFRIEDSFLGPDGTMVVKLKRNYPSADDLATADKPKVKLDFDERRAGVKSLMDAGNPGGNLPKKLEVADAAGVGKEVADIVRLRDRADYRRMLGQATRGVSAGPGGIGNKFFNAAQLLRLVPAMKSLGGGLGKTALPPMEASNELVSLIDRYVSDLGTRGGREHVAGRVMGEMVPEAKVLNLRGGQPARFAGASTRNEKGDSAKLTPEEEALARAVIKNLLKDIQ